MRKRVVTVYYLASSEDGRIRYVGQTVQDPKKRIDAHRRIPKQYAANPIYRWIRKLLDNGYELKWGILENNAIWAESEKRWIRILREQECDLLNLTDGGDGTRGVVWSAKSKAKASSSSKGRAKSSTHRLALSKAHMGLKKSRASIEKQRAKMKGRTPQNFAAFMAAKDEYWKVRYATPASQLRLF